jgi:hypothetical protein
VCFVRAVESTGEIGLEDIRPGQDPHVLTRHKALNPETLRSHRCFSARDRVQFENPVCFDLPALRNP